MIAGAENFSRKTSCDKSVRPVSPDICDFSGYKVDKQPESTKSEGQSPSSTSKIIPKVVQDEERKLEQEESSNQFTGSDSVTSKVPEPDSSKRSPKITGENSTLGSASSTVNRRHNNKSRKHTVSDQYAINGESLKILSTERALNPSSKSITRLSCLSDQDIKGASDTRLLLGALPLQIVPNTLSHQENDKYTLAEFAPRMLGDAKNLSPPGSTNAMDMTKVENQVVSAIQGVSAVTNLPVQIPDGVSVDVGSMVSFNTDPCNSALSGLSNFTLQREDIEQSPQNLEQLLDCQYKFDTQTRPIDIAEFISCLCELKQDTASLNNLLQNLAQRRDQLTSINASLRSMISNDGNID